MKILRISLSFLCLVILLIPLMRQDCHAQSIEQLKSGVVKITSKRPGGQEEEGSGFIVRLENNAAYIATAAHVIQGDSQPKVTFFRDFGTNLLIDKRTFGDPPTQDYQSGSQCTQDGG